jgi:hypothetical protein
VGGQTISSVLCTAHEFDCLESEANRKFAIKEVLYIEPESGPHGIVFLRIGPHTPGT